MIRRPPRSTQSRSSAASDVYKRQLKHDGQAAAWSVGEPDGSAVGGDEAVHDRQAEAGAVLAARGVPQECPRPFLRGHPWAVVSHRQHRARVVGLGADQDLSLIHISEPTRLGMISYAV